MAEAPWTRPSASGALRPRGKKPLEPCSSRRTPHAPLDPGRRSSLCGRGSRRPRAPDARHA
eukprot:14091234-Alexandrium_andersonii.AAC.1